ncbi:MAG: hypothetical protein QNK44_07890 [Hyphomicrobiaceae bacterium]|nr:hypothetical protein [Hyphomicrobiaceae bacterium]
MENMSTLPDVNDTESLIVVVGVVLLRQLFEFAGKQIPDTAIGWKAGLRKLFKILAIYTPNKEN